MTVHLHRLSRDLVCTAEIPFTNPVPGVILHEGYAYALMAGRLRSTILHYQETVIYTLPASAVRAVGDAFARAEAQS